MLQLCADRMLAWVDTHDRADRPGLGRGRPVDPQPPEDRAQGQSQHLIHYLAGGVTLPVRLVGGVDQHRGQGSLGGLGGRGHIPQGVRCAYDGDPGGSGGRLRRDNGGRTDGRDRNHGLTLVRVGGGGCRDIRHRVHPHTHTRTPVLYGWGGYPASRQVYTPHVLATVSV